MAGPARTPALVPEFKWGWFDGPPQHDSELLRLVTKRRCLRCSLVGRREARPDWLPGTFRIPRSSPAQCSPHIVDCTRTEPPEAARLQRVVLVRIGTHPNCLNSAG